MEHRLLEATRISKRFGSHQALDNVSLSVRRGSVYGLLGPNGAGKTTLIRIVNQITGPDSGEILFNGRRLTLSDTTNVGYLPEERGLYKKMKVGEHLIYLARLKGLTRNEAVKRMKFWFKRLDIGEWHNKKIEELSKGMQQKAQFISTVIHNPSLLIFDEPFSGFDPVNAGIIKGEILRLRDEGATVIFSTHNMSSVEELCSEITLIDKAKTILEGDVGEIRNRWAGDEYELLLEGSPDLDDNNIFSITSKKRENGNLRVAMTASDGVTTNDILGTVARSAMIISFNRSLPSMNDIFIRVVESKGNKTANTAQRDE